MSVKYYLTGKTRTVNIEFTASANIGRVEYYSPFRRIKSNYSGTLILPIISDVIWFGLDQTLQNFAVVINNQQVASYSFTGIQTINLTITYSFVADEAVTVEVLTNQFYDKVGKIDYPLTRRLNILEIINNRTVQISININNNTTTINRNVSLQVIGNYEGTLTVTQYTELFVVPSTYNNLSYECNSLCNLKVNNVNYFDVNYGDNHTVVHHYTTPPPTNFQAIRYGEIEVNGQKRIKTRTTANGLLIYNPASIYSEVQSHVKTKQTKKIDFVCKVYNLDEQNDEDVTINFMNENLTFKHNLSKFYDNIKPYEYSYTCIGKTGSGAVTDNRYDLAKITSNVGRFMFRTFMYNAINELIYSHTVDVGNYLDVNRYVVIQNASVVSQTASILFVANNSSAIVRYNINGDNTDYYFDSHRFLRLKLSRHISSTLNLKLKINNKEYNLNINSLPTTPTDYYIDLCKPDNATQTIDYKNNNFDENDSYSDYWGITKAKNIEIQFDSSFVLHSITLHEKLPNETTQISNKYTILGQRSTWQNEKRRVFVVRNRGKQTLELPDCRENQEITLNDIIAEINTNRWNGWSAIPQNYSTCNHTGNIHTLTPCLLNLNTPASFLCGCGNTYDGQSDYNYVNKNYVNNSQYKAQFLVDEITFYPDCGDVFYDLDNNERTGAIKLYASLIRRAQANGLTYISDVDVVMKKIDDTHYAGDDKSDFYQYYYIKGKYAKEDEYKVIAVQHNLTANKNCFDANEYRICFRLIEKPKIIINDIDYYEGKVLSTTNVSDAVGYTIFLFPDLDTYVKLDALYSSCDLKSGLILTAQDYIFNHSFGLKNKIMLRQLDNKMYPFVITYNGEIYVTYYKNTTKNFVFERYDANFNLLNHFEDIITTLPNNAEIVEQNFPITITEGMIIGVFLYNVGSARYIQFVSSVNGKNWIKQKEVSV